MTDPPIDFQQINDRYEFPLELDLDRGNGKYLSPEADKSIRNLYVLHRYWYFRPLILFSGKLCLMKSSMFPVEFLFWNKKLRLHFSVWVKNSKLENLGKSLQFASCNQNIGSMKLKSELSVTTRIVWKWNSKPFFYKALWTL